MRARRIALGLLAALAAPLPAAAQGTTSLIAKGASWSYLDDGSNQGTAWKEPGFIESWGAVARQPLAEFGPDHVLLSYHGLPERQILPLDASASHCLAKPDCCEALSAANHACYRAQCFATTRGLAEALGLEATRSSVSFQSRLGRTPWIRPYTDIVVQELFQQGVRRLAVLCPTFVADCLETLEEIDIRLREQWRELGGEDMLLVPCPNANPTWARAVADLVRRRCHA